MKTVSRHLVAGFAIEMYLKSLKDEAEAYDHMSVYRFSQDPDFSIALEFATSQFERNDYEIID